MEDKSFNGEVWRNLLRLTAENITPDMFSTIMRELLHRPDGDIHSLSFDQAQRLNNVLRPLPKLRKMLWEEAMRVVGPDQADVIVAGQLDQMAHAIMRDADLSLFPKD